MKYLIILLFPFIGNSQVLVMDIQQPIDRIEYKLQEELQFSELPSRFVSDEEGIFSLEFNEGRIYDIRINEMYFFSVKAVFTDDVLLLENEVYILCNCMYNIYNTPNRGNIIQLTF